jgi:hypothetical protein
MADAFALRIHLYIRASRLDRQPIFRPEVTYLSSFWTLSSVHWICSVRRIRLKARAGDLDVVLPDRKYREDRGTIKTSNVRYTNTDANLSESPKKVIFRLASPIALVFSARLSFVLPGLSFG